MDMKIAAAHAFAPDCALLVDPVGVGHGGTTDQSRRRIAKSDARFHDENSRVGEC